MNALGLALLFQVAAPDQKPVSPYVSYENKDGVSMLVDFWEEEGLFEDSKLKPPIYMNEYAIQGRSKHYLYDSMTGISVDGILGSNFIAKNYCVIDFIEGTCTPVDPGEVLYLRIAFNQQEFHSLRFDLWGVYPTIKREVAGKEQRFIFSLQARSHYLKSPAETKAEYIPSSIEKISKIDRNNVTLLFGQNDTNIISIPLLGFKKCFVDFSGNRLYYTLMTEEELFRVRVKYWLYRDVFQQGKTWVYSESLNETKLYKPFTKLNGIEVSKLIGRNRGNENDWLKVLNQSPKNAVRFE